MDTFTPTPRDCSDCCCVCPAPNGFGPDGNRTCVRFGPATWMFDPNNSERIIAMASAVPEEPPPSYEVCDYCENMVLETEMGNHECQEARDFLAAVAREFLEDEAGERDSDSEEEENVPPPGGS